MTMGITKTLATFQTLGDLTVDAITLVKAGGFRLKVIPELIDAMTKVTTLIQDAPAALPELMDLDAQESAQIGAAAYKLVTRVVTALT